MGEVVSVLLRVVDEALTFTAILFGLLLSLSTLLRPLTDVALRTESLFAPNHCRFLDLWYQTADLIVLPFSLKLSDLSQEGK